MDDVIESDYAEMIQHINVVVSDVSQICSLVSADCYDLETVDGVPIRKLFIGNLAERTTFKDLKKCFSIYGNIDSCYLRRNQERRNYAFVTFSNVEDAVRALKDGSRKQIRLHNRDLRVMPADSWHQPDSIEQQFYRTDKESNKLLEKRTANDQYTQGCLQNDINSVSIHMLNNDCLRHIFTFLPIVDRVRIEIVCKRWRALSQESWHTIKTLDLSPSTWGFSTFSRIHTATLRKVLLRCGRFLTQMNLSDLHCLSQSTLTIIGKLCPNLTNIDVSALTACASGLNVLASNCANITKFSLGPSMYSLDNDLKNLFKMHQNLEYLAINRNCLSGKCLSYLPVQTMHTIILNKCPYIQDNHLSIALKRLENLKNLIIGECIGTAVCTLEVISKHCKNLRVLELHGYLPFTTTMNVLYFTHLVNLQVLKITRNDKISDGLLVNMVMHCQQLTCVDITGCRSVTDVGLTAIATLPKLETLIINYMNHVTDSGLRNIYGLKELQCRACSLISDEGISMIILSSPHLQLLDLSGCSNITDATLEVAKRMCNSRSSNVMLKMIVGGTLITTLCSLPSEANAKNLPPFLQTVNVNMCEYDTLIFHSRI